MDITLSHVLLLPQHTHTHAHTLSFLLSEAEGTSAGTLRVISR